MVDFEFDFEFEFQFELDFELDCKFELESRIALLHGSQSKSFPDH